MPCTLIGAGFWAAKDKINMKKLIFLLLLPIHLEAQNLNGVSAYGGIDKIGAPFAGVSYEWLENQYDAYAGYIGKAVLYDSTALIMGGWKLQSIGTFQAYAGAMVGISTSAGSWFAGEIYGGFSFDWVVAPFFEVAYGNTLFKTGIKIQWKQ